MKILVPGHVYLLDELKVDGGVIRDSAQIKFVSRVGANYPNNVSSFDGLTSQEVIRCLIERAIYVNDQKPSLYTKISILLLRCVIWLYEKRAADIHKVYFNYNLNRIETYPTNKENGHIF